MDRGLREGTPHTFSRCILFSVWTCEVMYFVYFQNSVRTYIYIWKASMGSLYISVTFQLPLMYSSSRVFFFVGFPSRVPNFQFINRKRFIVQQQGYSGRRVLQVGIRACSLCHFSRDLSCKCVVPVFSPSQPSSRPSSQHSQVFLSSFAVCCVSNPLFACR